MVPWAKQLAEIWELWTPYISLNFRDQKRAGTAFYKTLLSLRMEFRIASKYRAWVEMRWIEASRNKLDLNICSKNKDTNIHNYFNDPGRILLSLQLKGHF